MTQQQERGSHGCVHERGRTLVTANHRHRLLVERQHHLTQLRNSVHRPLDVLGSLQVLSDEAARKSIAHVRDTFTRLITPE